MLYLIVGFLIGLSLGFHIGFYGRRLIITVKAILDRDPEPVSRVVTPLQPGYADVNAQSAFISPKTPQQIEREEQERVRSL
jgi:hypothetical protein